ncbi:hypothetical protein DdX_08861 [Ditylenchus destructor]|uniref:Uncharacterized protein n=1 Tax=Ditylenchus destructor TaxID=166010 RepID=A0AAD4R6R4_9BILA|nr:hypothetical protein DdX_08861 [Ditylenchus destructor]
MSRPPSAQAKAFDSAVHRAVRYVFVGLVAFRYMDGEATTHISGWDGWKEQAAAPGVAPHSIHPSLKSNVQPKGAATGKSGRRESSDEIAETEKTDGCIGRREHVVDDLR